MAFRALLFSKSIEANTAITAACNRAEIRVEPCSDIFIAIDKGKTRVFSCLIVDWADQPEASYLLKRARESDANRETIAVAIVDRDPTHAELRDSRLDFLIYRPISEKEAHAVLVKACAKMKPLSAEEARRAFEEHTTGPTGSKDIAAVGKVPGSPASLSGAISQPYSQYSSQESSQHGSQHDSPDTTEYVADSYEDETVFDSRVAAERSHTPALRAVLAAGLVLAAAFFLWNSRAVIRYLTQAPEGSAHVLRDAVRAFFDLDKSGAQPVGSAASDAHQDAYFSRPADIGVNAQASNLAVAATESTIADSRLPLSKAYDFPLPQPVVEHWTVPPVHIPRAAVPESMANSSPIERPIIVTGNPAQMMPVSAPDPQPQANLQQSDEPVALSEEAARTALLHIVNPTYPSAALAQKLHGPVILQTVIGRDGTVQDVKIVRGYFVLGKAAIAAVKQWKFQPYNLNGHAASIQTLITINFTYPPG